MVATLIVTFSYSPAAIAQGAGYWHTSGNQIVDSNGRPVRIAGLNWYGFETTDEIIHGLWAQDYHTILNELKSNGYNTIRMPFSNQMVETPINPTNFTQNANGRAVNTDLVGLNALQVMDKIIAAAGAAGLKVILDNHRSEAGNSNEANGLWYTSAFPESNWINDWVALATRYKSLTDANGNPIVIGMDLRNEPHVLANGARTGACWTGDTETGGCPTTNTAQNWPVAATKAANAILAVNPKLLIFVEGNDCWNASCGWQGGNLEGVATAPIQPNVPNQLVYSAHDYGPNLFAQPWFNSSTTFASLESTWNMFWGYVSENNIAPVWIGEFGTTNNASDLQDATPGSQGQWFSSLVNFLQNNPNFSWSYWAANGEDSYALLASQYDGIANSTKQSMLATMQFPLSTGGGTPDFSLSASPASLGIPLNANGSSTITVTPSGGFSSQVTLSVSGLPTGVTASFGANPTATGTVVTFVTQGNAATGPATVTITGASGSLTHTTTIALTIGTVNNPNFTLSASPASLSIAQGASGSSTIAVTPSGGFTGTVALSASGLPTGVTTTFSPTSTTGTSTLAVAASSSAATGPATVTITGVSGSLTHTSTIALTVNPANQGGGSVTITPVINADSPYYVEEDLKLTNTAPVTALSITITAARTTGISINGEYNTVGGSITQGASSTSSTITYTFTLNSGQTLSAGGYTFAAQMNGTGTAHPTSGDTYSVTSTAGGRTTTQTGTF